VDTLNSAACLGPILSLEAASNRLRSNTGGPSDIRDDDLGQLKLFNLTAKFEKKALAISSPSSQARGAHEEYLTELRIYERRDPELREKAVI